MDGNKVELVWFYCPLEQQSPVVYFKVYYDGGTGQVDYENMLAEICYVGIRFYSYQSSSLNSGRYLFCIRAEDADGTDCGSSAQVSIQLGTANPDAIDILAAESV